MLYLVFLNVEIPFVLGRIWLPEHFEENFCKFLLCYSVFCLCWPKCVCVCVQVYEMPEPGDATRGCPGGARHRKRVRRDSNLRLVQNSPKSQLWAHCAMPACD